MPYKDREKRLANGRKWNRTFYSKHRSEMIARVTMIKKKLKEDFKNYKSKLKCKDCGFSCKRCPDVCEFHHLNPSKKIKTFKGMQAILVSHGKKALIKEIKKCVLLCANCHRIRESIKRERK